MKVQKQIDDFGLLYMPSTFLYGSKNSLGPKQDFHDY